MVGVAFLQALALGVGFGPGRSGGRRVGAPRALPRGLATSLSAGRAPALAWVWLVGDGGTVGNAIGTLYLLAAGMADGLLKPYLLGRGVDTPCPWC